MRAAVRYRSLAPLVLLVGLLLLAAATPASAASPDPTSAAGGDPRSSGQGPGLVGDPVTAIGAVLLLAVVTVGATRVYLRFTAGQQDQSGGHGRT